MSGPSSRMLALLSLLQHRRDWPGALLADRLGVTPRTVRRDVERLRDLGYAITATKGPDGGYRLGAGAALPPLLLDDMQAIAIAVALTAAPGSGIELDEAAARALATVRQVMPERLRHRVDGIRFSAPPAAVGTDPLVLERVSRAAAEARVLRFDYGADAAAPRRVEPHDVVATRGRWYLVAWDLDRADWRVFRLDRMRPQSLPGARFERRPLPTRDAASFVAARAKGSDRIDRWPCVGELELELSAEAAAPWLGDADTATPIGTGRCRVVAGSWSWPGLLAWMLRFDAPFAVVGPPALREAAAAMSDRMAAAASGS